MLRIGMMTCIVTEFVGLRESIKEIKDVGFECIDLTLFSSFNVRELNEFFLGDDYLERAKEIKDLAESYNIPLVQSHAPFPVYQEGNEEYNKKMFDYLVKCIEICGVIGIPNIVIHPWNNFTDEQNIEFFKPLIKVAKKCNVVICTENMWNWDRETDKIQACACSLVSSFKNVVDGCNSPYLKACVDIGHAEMFSELGLTPRKLLEGLGDRVYCLHIHDNDGIHDYHLIPFDGVINFNEVVKGLKSINYTNDLITEVITYIGVDSLEKARQLWKKQCDSAKRLKEMIIG